MSQSDARMAEPRCDCPNSSYSVKHTALCYEKHIGQLRTWQVRAASVLPLIKREAGTALALEVNDLLRTANNWELPK